MKACEACGHRHTGMVRILCPRCMTSHPLTDGIGPVGAKVWECRECGHSFGPGTRGDRREGSRA